MFSDKLQLSLINKTTIKNLIGDSQYAEGQGRVQTSKIMINNECFILIKFFLLFSGICKKWTLRLDCA